ncbi:MAG: deoxyguanosinetriphosphate triphosphohydrolase [Candidatus Muiribacterium halophilum]|uniref:Deoxyguanosinetriphosphate triphosphohydrolase n=1 Tax=Muiribacterium halophilum TaxID=2053465 RepID=A0A2N5Z9N4_MUIH1|nr:MAG: deoxyguanosinetriphosphate triphosphohydrolase [Candidatus Muirbacterium halophilum]
MEKIQNIRKRIEEFELEHLNQELAFFAIKSKGRRNPEEESEIRTCFQRDRDRIIHSNSFRKLKDKTQVFILGGETNPRTRLTHTLEVAQIARTIARALRLNEDLTEAIALGHDLGHAPFGHLGEKVINSVVPFKFHHSLNSLRIVDKLEKDGRGLNLTFEVRDGILKHSKTYKGIDHPLQGDPQTLEADVVRFSDSIAYLNHDIYDAINMGIVKEKDFPQDSINMLGDRHASRIDTMVKSVIEYSFDNKVIGMSEDILHHTNNLREFMFENVYGPADKTGGSLEAKRMLEFIIDYYLVEKKRFLKDFNIDTEYDNFHQMLADKISSLTDKQAILLYGTIKTS